GQVDQDAGATANCARNRIRVEEKVHQELRLANLKDALPASSKVKDRRYIVGLGIELRADQGQKWKREWRKDRCRCDRRSRGGGTPLCQRRSPWLHAQSERRRFRLAGRGWRTDSR